MIHHNLQRYRKAVGLTQAALADRLGTSIRNVQNWEIGHRRPELDMLIALAKVFGVGVDALLAEEPPAKKTRKGK
jgi:HTH-type transcriptional regulator/antitoxin HipB